MAYAGKIFNPIRHSLALTITSKSISHSSQLYYANFEPMKTWRSSLELLLRQRFSSFQLKYNSPKRYIQKFSLSGRKSIASIFGASVLIGSVRFQPHFAYAMDGHDILFGDYHGELSVASSVEESSLAFWALVRKFWLPAFFLVTVLINLDHPIMLAMKIIVLLFSTRPRPLSVYLYIEQSLYANKVEVQDYKLLCIARVEVGDQKLTLVGILGGWWALPSSQSETQGVLSILRTLLRNKLV
ncbi:hypothetical protein JRO89_XS01G0236500 [Xanthoceras sorbifolium]|uniref:Uncharacterized protein n=1 Tax=Xanthoceras sorbifolium TaxID=99658 RepID=A0ABQ8IKU5_9ROSI|nr:hypothetical protein JRO89_XS01G0236500 [Xanthoceras sorbifolium]